MKLFVSVEFVCLVLKGFQPLYRRREEDGEEEKEGRTTQKFGKQIKQQSNLNLIVDFT